MFSRKMDVRLPGTGNSNSHGARLVYLIIAMITWIRTSSLPIKNSLSDKLWLAGNCCEVIFRRMRTGSRKAA